MSIASKAVPAMWLLLILPHQLLAQQDKNSPKLDLYGRPLPEGATARMQSAHLRGVENGQITKIAVSPKGNLVAAPTYANRIVLWDSASGDQLPPTTEWMSGRGPLTFSSDGTKLAVSQGQSIAVYEPKSGKYLRDLPCEGNLEVRIMAFVSDDKMLIGINDEEAAFWEVQTGKKIATINVPNTKSKGLAVAPNGKTVVLAGWDSGMQLWDVPRFEVRHKLRGHERTPVSVAVFTPDSKFLISGAEEDNVRIWDVHSGKLQKEVDIANVQCLAISSDGKLLAAGCCTEIVLCELPSCRSVAKLAIRHTGHESTVSFSPNGKRLIWSGNADSIFVAEINGDEIRPVLPKKLQVRALVFTPDDKSLITVGDDTVRLWESVTGKQKKCLNLSDYEVFDIAATTHHKRIALACSDRCVRVRETLDGKEIVQLGGHAGNVNHVVFSADGKRLASSSGTDVHLWDARTSQPIGKFSSHQKTVTALAFAADGSYLLSASEDQTVRLWDPSLGHEMRRFTGHQSPVTCVAIAPDGKHVISGSWNGVLRLWDPMTAKEIRSLPGHEDNISAVAFSPKGNVVASASWDRTVRLWDLSGKELARFHGHQDEITALAFSHDGQYLATGSRDHSVLLWRVADRKK